MPVNSMSLKLKLLQERMYVPMVNSYTNCHHHSGSGSGSGGDGGMGKGKAGEGDHNQK